MLALAIALSLVACSSGTPRLDPEESLIPLWERDPSLQSLLTLPAAEPGAAGNSWKERPLGTALRPCQELLRGPPPGRAAPVGARDVILITVDTWRADRLGSYGSPRATDPWLQELAKHATVFEQAVAPAPWTWPTMVSLTSGLHPAAHGAEQPANPLCEQADTLPKLFAASGWRTAMVATNVYMKDHAASFSPGFEYYCPTNRERGPDVVREVARAVDGFPADDPLFLWVHLFEPHCPYVPSSEALQAVRHRPFGSPLGEAGLPMDELLGDANYCFWIPAVPAMGPDPESAVRARPSAKLQDYLDAYDGELRDTDEILRLLAEVLKKRDRWDEAWVAITGDHGEEFADHGGFGHGDRLYQESTRVPLVVKPPRSSRAAKARRVKTTVSLVDLPRTLLSAVGLPVPPGWQGRDLGPAIGGKPLPAVEVFSETRTERAQRLEFAGRRLIIGQGSIDRAQLFDAEQDPLEGKDLLKDLPPKQWEERGRKLIDRLQRTREKLTEGRVCQPESVELSPEQVQRLKALGYLGSE